MCIEKEEYPVKTKKYSIEETTKTEREEIANNALAIALLGGSPPTQETMDLVQEYIDGKKEIEEILAETIQRYKVED